MEQGVSQTALHRNLVVDVPTASEDMLSKGEE